ncbi:MAG: hypothetical protein M3Z98_06590 [Candidatus Dormibacteraeota bacterium]|nr:hypothetical protein [Candidatus Dormibacteraeota bacterium]
MPRRPSCLKEAVGNDIGGMFIYIPLGPFTLHQYHRPPRIAATHPGS